MSVISNPTVYTGAPASMEGRIAAEQKTYAFLESLGIEYTRMEHAPADTIEACHAIEEILGVHICKNLFLNNRQGTEFYLLMMPGDKVFKTKNLSKILGTARLSFASAENMEKYLGLMPGSVTVLGLINDENKAVHLVIDRPVLEEEYIGCHPCTSTGSLKIKTADLIGKILPALGVEPRIIDLPEEDA